jgi:hypothetical protein
VLNREPCAPIILGVGRETFHIGKRGDPPPSPDAVLAVIAGRQHGVVSGARPGWSGAVSERVARGRLHRIHRGVYAVGHRGLSREGRWLAAVLAAGERAVLSHLSAAEHWELRRTSTSSRRAGAAPVAASGCTCAGGSIRAT